jgi:hypothetical protein
MAVEEVRDQNFREHITHHNISSITRLSSKSQIFRPPLAVDVYKKPRELDGVEIGRGSSGG